MRVLLDTNVLVAAFISHGHCHEVLERCVRSHELVLSDHLLREFDRALHDKLGYGRATVDDALSLLRSRAELVDPDPLPEPVSRDADDDPVLAAAAAGDCDGLVTGDDDLLTLGSYRGIPILEPARFWEFEAGAP